MGTYKELYKKTHLLIKHNVSDLTVHDKKMIKNNPGKPFLHITRDLGTTMFFLDDCSNMKELEELEQLGEIVNFYLKEKPLLILYHDDQKGFKKLNSKQAKELFRNYKEREKRIAKIKAIEEEQEAFKH